MSISRYLVVAVVFIGLLAGLPSWAAKSSANRTQSASAAVPRSRFSLVCLANHSFMEFMLSVRPR